ncbi:Ninja-family protein AFP2 [Linum perenne]
MGEAEGSSSSSRRATMESLSLEINRYPRDLLTRFVSTGEKRRARTMEEEDEEDEIELNLGLSLGGRFGVDKGSGGSKLARSSSIVGSIPESFKESDPAFGFGRLPADDEDFFVADGDGGGVEEEEGNAELEEA